MATQLQLRRGTTAEHSTFTGLEGELTYDTSAKNPVIHDGVKAGGFGVQTLGANALTPAANIATDLSAGNVHTVTLTVNATLSAILDNPTNLTIGETHTWVITQDPATARTLGYGSFFKFQGSSTINSALGSVTVIRGVVESANSIRCWIEVRVPAPVAAVFNNTPTAVTSITLTNTTDQLAITITPGSKVLVTYSGLIKSVSSTNDFLGYSCALYRNETVGGVLNDAVLISRVDILNLVLTGTTNSKNSISEINFSYLDTPTSTTTGVTYIIQIAKHSNPSASSVQLIGSTTASRQLILREIL